MPAKPNPKTLDSGFSGRSLLDTDNIVVARPEHARNRLVHMSTIVKDDDTTDFAEIAFSEDPTKPIFEQNRKALVEDQHRVESITEWRNLATHSIELHQNIAIGRVALADDKTVRRDEPA